MGDRRGITKQRQGQLSRADEPWRRGRHRRPPTITRRGRRASAALALALLIEAGSASATPIPLPEVDSHGVHRWPIPKTVAAPPLWLSLPPIQSTDILRQEEVIRFDPNTGSTTARLDLTVLATDGPVSTFLFYLDGGLDAVSATASQGNATFTSQIVQGFRAINVEFDAINTGQEVTISVTYDGVLGCADLGGYRQCDIQPTMSVVFPGSLLPMVFDESNLGGYNLWGAERALELTLPTGTDMVAPGTVTLDEDDGTWRTMRFETPGYHTAAAVLAMFGDFNSIPLQGTSPPSTLHAAADAPLWVDEMALWMEDIYAFVDAQAGQSFPWTNTEIVKLPSNWIFPGTAGHGIVLLAESYGNPGAGYFEETLAHETSHEWWGILASPTDYRRSRWLVEGLATLSQIDYAADVLHPDIDRETYLGRRYREHDIMMRYAAAGTLPAVVPLFPIDAGENDTLWAYIRSSAALDSLRVLIGEDNFAAALHAWATNCAMQLCDTNDFKAVLETTAGQDLSLAFDAYVFNGGFPEPLFAFSQTEDELTVIASNIAIPLPLELWIEHDDHTTSTARVTVAPDEPTVIAIDRSVRSVHPNPRHAGVARSRSVTDGDVTYDGAVDGLDIITCARALGTRVQSGAGSEGVFRIDLDFLPACDRNADAAVTTPDVDDLLNRFATEAP